jgi:hypothetical protein
MMNLQKLIFSLFLLITTAFNPAFSQQDSIDLNSIIARTTKLSNELPLEKVYLHFDKPYYAVGDTVWFKAYVTSLENQPSALSKIVYVEVITSTDSLVETLKLPLTSGVSSGSIPLSELSYKQGNYRIRAYTKWMSNFDNAYFFTKVVPVGNAINKRITTHISFIGSKNHKGSKVNARVQYKDTEGNPYANRRVNWSVELGYDTFSKGKGTTDNNGFLSLSLSNSQKQDLSQGKLITVLNVNNLKFHTSSFPLRTAFNKLDVQFFPEGGELIDGISSKVAFKAVQSDGLGKDIKGEIVDNEGKVVVNFKSQHLGMGVFTLFPEAGKTYKANIIFPDGSKSTYSLPVVQPDGITLQVNSAGPEDLNLRIATNPAYYQKYKNKGFYIVGQSGTVIYYAAQTQLKGQVFTAAIPKSKFPPGILQLTLFNSSGEPISERLAFIYPVNAIKIAVNTDRQVYTPKQKVQFTLSANNQAAPVEGNFSISVVDETKVPFDENAETTILSSLLLTSDLQGFIEKPNYYFNQTDDKKLADLDVLMLTQGYRRFSYKDIIENKYPPITVLPEQGIEITGTLRTSNGMPVNKGNMRINIPDRNYSAYAVTNTEGRFKFSDLVLADSSKVTIDSRNTGNSKNMMIMLDGTYFPAITKNINFPQEVLNIDSSLNTYIQNSKKQYRNSHVLEEVVITDKPIAGPSHSDHAALSGLSNPDHLISGDRFKDCPYLLSCLQSSVMGMTYDRDNFYVTRDYNAGSRVPVQVYLNGMAVDMQAINTIRSAEVESVEIFLKDELGLVNRTSQTNGILVINTKKIKMKPISKQEFLDLLPQNNVVSLNSIGYSKERHFYSPKYDVSKNIMTNDLRSTIYWNPAVITDKTGKASVGYFNADGKGIYRAVIEGIDSDGNPGRYIYRYTVK